MLALVTTARFLLLVDTQRRTVTPVESHRGEYYGVTWRDGDEELILSHSGIDNETLVDLAGYANSEYGWVSHGELQSPTFLSAPHQLCALPDRRIACTNTGRNCITIIDVDRPGLYHEIRASAYRWDRLSLKNTPGEHLNSVFFRNNELWVVAHRFTKGSQVLRYSFPDLRLIDTIVAQRMSGLHNVWITDDNQCICCHSEAGSVVDIANGRVLWESGSPIYTRGLAATDRLVLVGESASVGRDLRSGSLSGLWVLDRATWTAIDYLCLGPYGCVHEVRILDQPDEAHNRTPFSGLDRLLARDERTAFSAARLSTARTASLCRTVWSGFDFVFGRPTTLEDGFRFSASTVLSLVVHTSSENAKGIGFAYRFDKNHTGEAHASAVLGYHGGATDTRMSAILIQPDQTQNTAVLSLWHNDGTAWTPCPNVALEGLPVSGTVLVLRDETSIHIYIDCKKRLVVPVAGLPTITGQLGIRWIGCAVGEPVLEM